MISASRVRLTMIALMSFQFCGCGGNVPTPNANSASILRAENPFPPTPPPTEIKDASLPYVYGRVVVGGEYPKPGSITVQIVDAEKIKDQTGAIRYDQIGSSFPAISAKVDKEGIYGVALPQPGQYCVYLKVNASAYPGKSFNPYLGPIETPYKIMAMPNPLNVDIVIPLRDPVGVAK